MLVAAMEKKMIIFYCLLLAMTLVFVLSWRWHQTPYAEINPVLWQQTVIKYGETGQHQTLWLHKRHAAKLQVSAVHLLIADDKQIPIQLQSISYPTLYPKAIRVDFELVDPADKEMLLKLHRVELRKRRSS